MINYTDMKTVLTITLNPLMKELVQINKHLADMVPAVELVDTRDLTKEILLASALEEVIKVCMEEAPYAENKVYRVQRIAQLALEKYLSSFMATDNVAVES